MVTIYSCQIIDLSAKVLWVPNRIFNLDMMWLELKRGRRRNLV
jgi:hypothetical protein